MVEQNKATRRKATNANGVNGCAIEAMAAYAEKANGWEQDVLTATGDPAFDPVRQMSKKHAEPLEHLRYFVLQVFTEE